MNQVSGMKLIAGYYWYELKKHPWHVVSLLLMVPTAIFLNVFTIPYVIAGIIDTLSKGSVPLDQVWVTFGDDILLFTTAVIVGELILWRLIIFVLWRLEKKVVFDLYMRCFDFLTHQSAQFHADAFTGSLVSQTNKFSSSYIRLVDGVVFQILPFVSTLVFTFSILGTRVPLFAVGLAVLSGIFIWINAASYGKIRHLNEVESEANNKMSGHIADMIGNVLAVKSFSAEARETKRFRSLNKTAAAATENVLQNSIKRDVGFGSVLVVVMVFMMIFILVGQATLGITIGTMVLMLSYSMTLFNQLWTIHQITRNYNRIYGDALPMAKVLQSDITVEDTDHPKKLRVHKGAITFQDITFTHDGSSEALFKHFNLTVQPGERIGLIGPSGSGKTTLTKLLLRFADIDDGSISIDSQDIRSISQHDLRRHI
ncbi:MAG TPA: ABC transporter ATP-binding protein, partial [Candidatus Saccharimonadales bacterium]